MLLVNLFLKRIMDILGSLIGIIVLAPLLIILSIAIIVDSKGPVLFKQDRLGKNGIVFKIWKFRTMVVDAEKIGDGLIVKESNDNRITNVGRFLRKLSFDELPQLFNVLIGNMSLVGPRPPVTYHPYEFDDYPKDLRRRFLMKPGITGLSQITVRNSVVWDERIKVDLNYISKFNVLFDIKILFLTVLKIFSKKDIYIQSDKE